SASECRSGHDAPRVDFGTLEAAPSKRVRCRVVRDGRPAARAVVDLYARADDVGDAQTMQPVATLVASEAGDIEASWPSSIDLLLVARGEGGAIGALAVRRDREVDGASVVITLRPPSTLTVRTIELASHAPAAHVAFGIGIADDLGSSFLPGSVAP